MVNPPDSMQNNYNFLVSVEEEILKALVAGAKLCDVYENVLSFVKKEKPEFVDKLTKTFGFAMGIEFRESSLTIGPKTTAVVKKGSVFNVNVGLSGLSNKESSDKEGKTYALFIGDTVIVNDVSRETSSICVVFCRSNGSCNVALFCNRVNQLLF